MHNALEDQGPDLLCLSATLLHPSMAIWHHTCTADMACCFCLPHLLGPAARAQQLYFNIKDGYLGGHAAG